MSKIKRIEIKNFLGISELGIDAGKINIFKGPKGAGKSSIIEAVEKTFTNRNRRTEVIKHGEEEATLFVQLDNGLEIDRRIRSEKADYLKLRKDNEGVPSTEKYLKSLINGDIFRPVDWVNKSVEEQTKSILSMLEIGWSMEDIEKWFGETPYNIDFNQHILQILKAIEVKYFKDREEVNREIKELKAQINVIRKELPAEYDGEEWRDKKIQEYYNKVSESQKINKWIDEAKALQESIENKKAAIEANAESEKNKTKLRYKEQRSDIKDIIDLSKNKIEKAKSSLENSDNEFQLAIKNIDLDTEKQIQEAIQKIKDAAEKTKIIVKKTMESNKNDLKDIIGINENKISAKEQELLSIDELETQAIEAIEAKKISEVEKEELRVGKAAEYLKNNTPVDIEPLQKEADHVADMQSYLRQWDNMISIRDGKLAEKERCSNLLTARIETARKLPQELLKTATMPIDGISVDEKGLIRINGTLIDGLSDGEKLTLAMKIARTQAGELKCICIDRFESLNPAAQEKLISEIEKDDFQYFITSTSSDVFEVEKIG